MTLSWRETVKGTVGDISKLPKQYRKAVASATSSRENAIRYISDIGGYRGGYGDRYPLAWNVRVWPNLDADHLFKVEADTLQDLLRNTRNPGEVGIVYNVFAAACREHEEHLFNWATEEAWESFRDDDGSFWGIDLDCKWELAGRSGGNLVLVSVQGRRLRGVSHEELEEAMRERDPDDHNCYVMAHADVLHILLVCIQVVIDWGLRSARNREIEYRAAWRIAALIEHDLPCLLDYYRNPKGLESGSEEERTTLMRQMLGME